MQPQDLVLPDLTATPRTSNSVPQSLVNVAYDLNIGTWVKI